MITNCKTCHISINSNRDRLYCSQDCYNKSREKKDKICRYCKKEYTPNNKKRKYCSPECWVEYQKGKPRITPELRKKLNEGLRGTPKTDEHKKKISKALKGIKSPWTAKRNKENARSNKWSDIPFNEYLSAHNWVRRKYGRPKICEHCKRIRPKGELFDWANVSHTYKKDRSDWLQLCRKCHYKFDKGR